MKHPALPDAERQFLDATGNANVLIRPATEGDSCRTTVAGEPTDAIDEAPDAAWNVRSADGTQYGPVTGDVLRAWVRDGRVNTSSTIWREGWPAWRPAGEVFSQLSANQRQ